MKRQKKHILTVKQAVVYIKPLTIKITKLANLN